MSIYISKAKAIEAKLTEDSIVCPFVFIKERPALLAVPRFFIIVFFFVVCAFAIPR